MSIRGVIHTLVDELPDGELAAAERYLEFLKDKGHDPLKALLASAPPDDEPVTEDDLTALREGLAEASRGDVISHDEVRRRLADSAS